MFKIKLKPHVCMAFCWEGDRTKPAKDLAKEFEEKKKEKKKSKKEKEKETRRKKVAKKYFLKLNFISLQIPNPLKIILNLKLKFY